MKTTIKIILWTLMSVVLLATGTLICAVKMLTPERLTPVVERVADNMLDADVSLGRVELSFAPAFPVLRLSVDSVCVISGAFSALTQEERGKLPPYADTLLCLDHLSGAIALDRMLTKGEIALRDVVLRGPAVNIVIAPDSLCNYNILASSPEDSTETTTMMPPFSIDRFRLEDAREFRYFNATDSTGATIVLLEDSGLDGTEAPAYRISIGGNVSSPLASSFIDLEKISFGADGRVRWNPATPETVSFEKFSLAVAFLRMSMDAEIDMGSNPAIRSGRFELHPVAVDSLLAFVPADTRRKWRLARPYFRTDATVSLRGELLRPFVLADDSIPHADVDFIISDSPLSYGRMQFENLALDLCMVLGGNNPDSTVVNLRRLEAAGPATRITAKVTLKELIRDPRFDACIKLHSDISRLPAIVADMAGGYLSGIVDADVDLRGRQSMFSQRNIHRLDAEGTLDADNVYFLRNDTNLMAEIGHATLKFGTGVRFKDRNGNTGERTLAAGIRVDTANILSGGIGIGISGVALGFGVENNGTNIAADTTTILPMGGMLKIGRLNLKSVSDSAGMNLRELKGHVSMTRYQGKDKFPKYDFRLTAARISAGAPTARVMLRDPSITFSAHKLLSPRISRKIRSLTDSIARVHPELSPDSVYRLAIEKRRRRPGEKVQHRVHPQLTAEETQVLEWGTSKALRKLLLSWDLRGSITTRRARLFTPVFPLRNRISNVDIRFNNDSIILTDIRYKGGRSDITVNGTVSNLRRSFTSKGYRSPLRANLSITSKAIDVNELAAATFAGAAYSERLRRGTATSMGLGGLDEDEESLERRISESSDSTAAGPLLLPTNIDARLSVHADSIFYSDLKMNGLTGDVLLYNGALNLNNLRCTSDIGSLTLDALYSAPGPEEMKFGFGLDANRFDVRRFLKLMPAIDSIMPLMRDFGGTISAEVAATCDVDPGMNLVLPSLDAAVRLQGDSLQFIDSKTYRTIGKWLGFKDKESNIIKHLDVELTVSDNLLQIYPFMLDIDRYRLGVQGYNDLNLNFNYHLAVLKSPLPFKFGVTVKGNPDKYKVRIGGAKFKADAPAAKVAIVDTARVNLITQIQNIFRRGVRGSRFARVNMGDAHSAASRRRELDIQADDTLSRSDSLTLIREGVIEAPITDEEREAKLNVKAGDRGSDKKKKDKGPRKKDSAALLQRKGNKK